METKFVHNGNQVMATGVVKGAIEFATPQSSYRPAPSIIVPIRSRTVLGGASYSTMRLQPSLLQNPTTMADRVAARLVGHCDKGPNREMMTTIGYIKCLPPRLCNSAALRDCVSLFCSTWANFERAVPLEQLVDAKLYGKALRSLYSALNDHTKRLCCETLAAVSIVTRFEVLFDIGRSYNRAAHVRGLYSLMVARGPPKLNDELDMFLALDNQGTLVCVFTFLIMDLADLLSWGIGLWRAVIISTLLSLGKGRWSKARRTASKYPLSVRTCIN